MSDMKVQTTWGLRVINQLLRDPSTIRIGASDMELDGFEDDHRTEYREEVRGAGEARRVPLL